MLMSAIYTAVLTVSILFACISGTLPQLTSALFLGAQLAVSLTLSLAGALCLWSGVLRVMEDCGLSAELARLLRPLLGRLFPDACRDGETAACLAGNFSANLLGLGSAATPLGVRAACRMSDGSGAATNELCRLVVLNTASIQLIPATVASVRAALGAASPFSILPAVLVTSLCSVSAGLLTARLLEGRHA